MQSDDVKGNDVLELLDVNDLSYLLNNKSNIVTERTLKRQFADATNYSNTDNNLVVNWQTGQDFIDSRNSTLRLRVRVNGGTTPNWGFGDVRNIIENVRILSRGGIVLGRIERFPLLSWNETKWKRSPEWFGDEQHMGLGQASLMGYNPNGDVDLTAVGFVEYHIPLKLLHPFFDQNVLLPSQVCKGLRLELTLATDLARTFRAEVAPTSYEVEGVYCVLDSYRLADAAMVKLNEMSASRDGLALQYKDWESNNFPVGVNTTRVSLEVRKTVSMANSAFAVVRNKTSGAAAEALIDSYASAFVDPTDEYQFRIGSMYYPQTSIAGPKAFYSNAVYCCGNYSDDFQPSACYSIDGVEVAPSFAGADHLSNARMCVDVNRYRSILSGVQLNNSLTMSLNIQFEQTKGNGREVDLYLCHTRRCIVYDENIVLLE